MADAGNQQTEATEFARLPETVSIFAVLVLYRQALAQSKTWHALVDQVNALPDAEGFRLLVCDNGPLAEVQTPVALPEWAEYVAIRENRGLAWAYNLGLTRAIACNAAWLLTLDQDTMLPADFVARVSAMAMDTDLNAQGNVAAIVPQLVGENGRVHSPVIAAPGGERALERGFVGYAGGEVRAFNSAALVRVRALESIGSYDRRFWLDYLDHSLFHALHLAGLRVWIRGDLQLRHNLSLHDDRKGLSEQRFQNFSMAESAFRDLYVPRMARLLYTARLLLRAINQKRRGDAEHFFRTTLSVLRERVMVRRKARIERWEAAVAPMCAEPEIGFQVKGSSAHSGTGERR